MPDHHVAAKLRCIDELDQMLRDGEVVLLCLEQSDGAKRQGDYVVETSASPRRRHGRSLNLPDAIIDATKHPPQKLCLRPDCKSKGFPQPLANFGPDRDSRDGHGAECRACASTRIGVHAEKKRRAKERAKEGGAAPETT